ncbi:MAG: DUF4013 domain-containing protein [Anaerolineae bacterium]
MAGTISTANLQSALSFVIQDKKWGSKVLIAGLMALLCCIIPIIPVLLLLGYQARIMRRITNEDGKPALPDWNNWGDMFIDGLRLLAINIIYLLPGILVFLFGYVALFASAIGGAAMARHAGDGPGLVGVLFMWFFFGFGILLGMAGYLFSVPAQVHAISKSQFSAAFDFRAWWRVFKSNWIGFVLAIVVVFGLSQAMGLVFAVAWLTICLICLTPFIIIAVMVYTLLVTSALYALAYREGTDILAAPPSES